MVAVTCIPYLINCTVSRNSANLTIGQGGGLEGNYNGHSNIIYGNYGHLNAEIFQGYFMFTYTCCATAISGTGNITSNPMFVNPDAGNFNLSWADFPVADSTKSPCIDTGNPSSPLDPDGSRADMGGLYFNEASVPPPQIDVTMTPLSPPISVPVGGGSFQFNASVINHGPNQAPFVVWGRIKNPNGTYTNTLLGPVTINPPVNVSVMRLRNQNVPGTWAAGVYTYLGYGNWTYTYPALDSSSFTFTKLATGAGPCVWDAACSGEPFPGEEQAVSSQESAARLKNISPNPFNPATVLSYELRVPSYVSLKVYDTAGRLVATLVEGVQTAGGHSITFDGSKLASGIYLAKLTTGGFTAVQKLVLMK